MRAAPVVDARKAVKTLLSAGKAFQRALTEPTEMDGRFYAFHLIRNYIRDDRLGEHIAFPGPLANLSSVLNSFVIACEKSLGELRDPGRAEIMVGEAWATWICELTTLLAASGLPTSARKDTDKRPGPSDFEVLIEQLQSLVPQSCRRRGSLSGPIGRARARLGTQRSAQFRDNKRKTIPSLKSRPRTRK